MMREQISNFHHVGEDRGERGIAHAALKKNGKKNRQLNRRGLISNFYQVEEDRGERGIAHAAFKKKFFQEAARGLRISTEKYATKSRPPVLRLRLKLRLVNIIPYVIFTK